MKKQESSFALLEKMEICEIINNTKSENFTYTFGIPTYKRSVELREAIESVYSQKAKVDFNVIISDNNPERNDETEIMMKEYYSDKPNLLYFKNIENIGSTNNWNRLFQYCQTPYLIMLHDDDVLFENYLERIEYFMKRLPEVSALNCEKITWNGKESRMVIDNSCNFVIRHNVYTNFLHFNYGTPSGCLFNVNDVRAIGGYNEEYGNSLDYALIMKFLINDKVCIKTIEPLMLYRWGNNASTKFEVLRNLLENDYRLKEDVAKLVKINSLLKGLFDFFDIKIRLRSILKINGKRLTFRGYKYGGDCFVALYKVFCFFYYNLYINHYCKEKV